jgi:hypothetical protein
VKAVLAEAALAGRKSCNQTNLHSLSGLASITGLSKESRSN